MREKNQEKRNKILALIKIENGVKNISSITGYATSFIYRVLKDNNIKITTNIKSHKFSKDEIKFLFENYSSMGTNFCAKSLNLSRSSIRNKIQYLKLKINWKMRLIKDNKKFCNKCNTWKNISDFQKAYYANGYRSECTLCKHAVARERIIKIKSDEYTRKIFGMKNILRGAKERAKNKNMKYNLDLDWFLQNAPEICPIFGCKLMYMQKGLGQRDSASIDRVNNNKGYTKDNCIIISYRANAIKNTATVEELIILTNFYKNLKNNTIN